MEMIKVESSNIERIGSKDHDIVDMACTVRVDFKGRDGQPGTTYDYTEVNLETWNEFVTSDSKGKFFHRHIKGQYSSVKVSTSELILEKAQELVEDSRLRWKDLDKKTRLRHLDQVINLCMSAAECENKVDSKA